MPMQVVQLRRYPVKSMGGEPLDRVALDERGLAGDRWFAVEDAEGRFASGKTTRRFRRRDAVFGYSATTSATGDVVVTGASGAWQVGDPALEDDLRRAMGTAARITPEADVPHQDRGAVSIIGTATLDWCAERWGVDPDPRRLRVNVVFSSTAPFIEETWARRTITVGTAVLRVVERAPRCRMIDVPQDGTLAEGRWLVPLAAERDMCLAMYADVASTGVVGVGDALVVS